MNQEKNKLRVFTAFSGYDSQLMALDRLGIPYECVGWAEIDKYAIQSHNAVYPELADKNFKDIAKINWSEVPNFDLFTYSFPCLTEDSLILTKEGYKEYKDLKVGDLVLTKKGTYKPIAKLFDNGVHPTCHMWAKGLERLHCTYNHKFLVRSMKRIKEGDSVEKVFTEPIYKEAKDLQSNDYIGIPVDISESIPQVDATFIKNRILDPDFWYMMGCFASNGWIDDFGKGYAVVIITPGTDEKRLVTSLKAEEIPYTISVENGETHYVIHNDDLVDFASDYGFGNGYKRIITGKTMQLPLDLLKSFVEGCLDTEGCGTRYIIKSISREYIYGLSYCLARVFHIQANVDLAGKTRITMDGKHYLYRDSYKLTFNKEPSYNLDYYADGCLWYNFRSLTPAEIEHVYNMEVEDEHSYIVQGCISKNCTDISNAGLQKGLTEGSGTRSGLLWECKKAIEAKHPRWLLMENVKALVSKKFMPEFQKWLDYLDSQGYRTTWQIMNAKDYGVPQNRERVFAVSELSYQFPKPWELKYCLQDVLEDEVDESYYLKDETLDKFQFDEKFKEEYERIKAEREGNPCG